MLTELYLGYPVFFVNGTVPVVEVEIGESAVLQCEFGGTPTPAVTWKRNGISLPVLGKDGTYNHEVIFNLF